MDYKIKQIQSEEQLPREPHSSAKIVKLLNK